MSDAANQQAQFYLRDKSLSLVQQQLGTLVMMMIMQSWISVWLIRSSDQSVKRLACPSMLAMGAALLWVEGRNSNDNELR